MRQPTRYSYKPRRMRASKHSPTRAGFLGRKLLNERSKSFIRHELSHMLDYRKYGDDYYKLFTPAMREEMVLERLKNNRIWKKLNDAERDWALTYPSTR
jgi:hypothetical protein